jgi:cysteine desulfurase
MNVNPYLYFDHNATTPVADEVLQAMLPFFQLHFANAASQTHPMGRRAKDAVELARTQVAELLNAETSEIYFTSGATEALNTALKGIFSKYKNKGKHIVSVATEHSAVLDTLTFLEKQGAEITLLLVVKNGMISLQELENAIRKDTVAVAVMLANNETGAIHPIQEIAALVHQKDSILVCDATQAVGKIKVDVQELGIDVLAMSAHKMYGPKGVGALYLRRKSPRVVVEPLLHGGGHERGVRSGTLNIPGIVGLGAAATIAPKNIEIYEKEILPLKQQLETSFIDFGGIINGGDAERLPNTVNVTFPSISAEDVIRKTQSWLAISTGSACSSVNQEPSHVLKAMGLTDVLAKRTLRFSLGVENTKEEVERILVAMNEIIFK